MDLLDVTRPLLSDMPRAFAYPSPVFEPRVIATQPDGEPVSATRIEMFSHVGTHIEASRHLSASGRTLDSYPLERFQGPGRVADLTAPTPRPVTAARLEEALPDLDADAFVLLRLGNPVDTGEDGPHSHLSEDAARWLVRREVRCLGVDTSTPDLHVSQRPHRLDLPVHQILFAADLLLIENLGGRLADACGRHVTVHAFPLSLPGSDSSPVRVVLGLDG